jgi:RNA recognition motif-containing protein
VTKGRVVVFFADSLWNYFSQYGELSDAVVIMDRQSGRSRGFGFVTFKDPRCVDSVLDQGQHSIDGRQVIDNYFISVNRCKERKSQVKKILFQKIV